MWSPLLLVACVVMALFALSPTVTAGSRVLVDLDGPWSGPLAVFRSSGRFAWPLAYVLVISAVVTLARRLPPRASHAALAVAVIAQLVDLQGAHDTRRRAARDPAFHTLGAAVHLRALECDRPALSAHRAGAAAAVR